MVGNSKVFSITSHSCKAVLISKPELPTQIAWGPLSSDLPDSPTTLPTSSLASGSSLQETCLHSDLRPLTKRLAWEFEDLHSTAVYPFTLGLHFRGRARTLVLKPFSLYPKLAVGLGDKTPTRNTPYPSHDVRALVWHCTEKWASHGLNDFFIYRSSIPSMSLENLKHIITRKKTWDGLSEIVP